MSSQQIQFTAEDVVRKFRELHTFGLEEKLAFTTIGRHALQSPAMDIVSLSELFSGEDFPSYALDTAEHKNYATNILDSSKEIMDITRLFLRHVESVEFPEKAVQEMAAGYLDSLGILSKNVDRLCCAGKPASSDEKVGQRLSEIHASLGVLLYVANRIFSPNFRKDTYYFAEDLNAFVINMARPMRDCGISLGILQNTQIRTLDDYVGNAVASLVWNAKEHALNPG